MGKQRNNPQSEGKEESSEKVLKEIEASQLSDIEFKTMVIRKFNKFSENYQKLQGNCEELTANYIIMKKDIGALTAVAQWIEPGSVNQKVAGLIPHQGTCLGCKPGPQ